MKTGIVVGSLLLSVSTISLAYASASAVGAKVYIVEPQNNAIVTGPVTVKFGIDNMAVVPAGTDQPNSGHHHLLVNVDSLPAGDGPIAKDEQHIHFGKAQTETTLTLPPGKHTLQLVFGDKDHVPHQPVLASEKITITVKE